MLGKSVVTGFILSIWDISYFHHNAVAHGGSPDKVNSLPARLQTSSIDPGKDPPASRSPY